MKNFDYSIKNKEVFVNKNDIDEFSVIEKINTDYLESIRFKLSQGTPVFIASKLPGFIGQLIIPSKLSLVNHHVLIKNRAV